MHTQLIIILNINNAEWSSLILRVCGGRVPLYRMVEVANSFHECIMADEVGGGGT